MAQTQYKVNQFAKDLNMKSKDIVDILEAKNISVKSQATLDAAQFNVLFEALTTANQIVGIEDYIDGITQIPSAKKVPEKKDVEKKEPAAEVSAEKVAQAAKDNTAKKSDEAAKKETAESSQKPVPEKNNDKPETKVEAPKTETKAEMPKAEAPQKKESQEPRKEELVRKPQAASQNNHNNQNNQSNQGNNQYQQRPQGNSNTQRPQMRQDNNQRPQSGSMQNRQGSFDNRQNKSNDRFGNPFTQGGQRPVQNGGNRKPDNRQQGGFKDKDEGGSFKGGKIESFKPQAVSRPETQKGEKVTKKGNIRVVDMRAGSVDLSKYDERLDKFAADMVGDLRGGNQRVKKQAPQNNKPIRNNKKAAKGTSQPVTKAPTSVTIPDEIMVSDLASRLKVTSAEVVKRLMLLGMMVTVNQTVDFDTAAIVADEMGIAATREVVVTIEEKLFEEEEDNETNLVGRAPVVCVMGHVDHGKTSILDAIRHTSVTRGEAGGITQHIGAYRVRINDQDITFLDTPGHEAFTAMRARGAQATDIAVLVVAADDGIMPQTIEAINHAKAAGIDIIVAINKMDKPTANPDMVKQELTKYDLVPEDWGGDVICVPVSALTGFGIEDLLENILLVAEVKELKANPKRRAKGIVIEAKLDRGRGPVATILVQSGTLHSGDIVIAGTAVGRVRAMTDHNGKKLKEAGPSVPVEIIGLDEVPLAGDEFNGVEDERMARTLADQRRAKAKEEEFKANARASLNDLFAQISEGVKELNIIVKADVGGSAEAVKQSLEKISNDEVRVRVIHAAAGGIRENDVMLAAASNAIIVGFNVRPDRAALDSAERQNVEIRTYRVIYDCINEITDAMKGMLAPKFKETLLGHAEVRQTIHVPNVGTIAGSYVQDGKVVRSAMIRVVRDGVVIFEDKISSLKRFKDDAKEVAQGYECGIGLDRFNDIKIGDILEAYVMEEIER